MSATDKPTEAGPGLESTEAERALDRAADPPSTQASPDRDATTPPGDDATRALVMATADTERIVPAPDDRIDPELPRIPGYEVLGVLGIGGMGIVYKATQARLDRLVALKMIRAGAGARPGDLLRFEAEARAVAAIDHPNIIKIYEIGEHGGLPFFSLEFVAGGSLARRIDGKPLPVGEAARIVEILARAMGVAHARGIVHRDIKPANVLIAPDGTPKLADFGLVKRLESDSGQTRAGSILGSPSYMAPEQAVSAEKVGPAADQYALGATLYEMLTGRPPFRGASVLETLDLVRDAEPVPPSQLRPRMPRDLETIGLKCLQKDPARRYPDVDALADDLRRFRDGEPILARPTSGPERLWRWCRRNRRVAALAAAVALLLVVVAVGSSVALFVVSRQGRQLRRANADLVAANDVADRRRREAEDLRERAEAERKKAVAAGLAAVRQNRSVVTAQREMIDLLENRLANVPALQDVREKSLDLMAGVLASAADSMAELRAEVGWPPEDEELNARTLALAHQRIGEVKLSLNRLDEAEKEFRYSNRVVERLAAGAPGDPARRVRLLRSHRQLGWFAQYKRGDFAEALRQFHRSADLAAALNREDPDDDPIKDELANSLGLMATAELRLGHLARAREVFEREREVRESFAPDYAGQAGPRRGLAGLYDQLFGLALAAGDRASARRYNDRGTEIRRRLVDEFSDSWPDAHNLAISLNNAGMLLYPQGNDPAGARAFHRQATDLLAKRVAADPKDAAARSFLATTLYYEATCAGHAGDRAGSMAGYRRCLELREALATDPKAKMARIDLMLALARCGEHARASAIADDLMAHPPVNEQICFQAACGYALSAGALRGMPGRPDEALIRRYTERAIDCVRRARERGWADVEGLRTDPDLEPIRNEPAFKSLLAAPPKSR